MVLPQEPHGRPYTRSTDDRGSPHILLNSNPPSPEYHATRYFREPRHNSLRAASMLSKLPAVSDKQCHQNFGLTPSDLSERSLEIASSTLIASSSRPSSARSDSLEDGWHDTHSVPLGPRWHDYTYREGDAFYGARPRPTTIQDVTVAPLPSTQAVSRNAWNGSLRSMSSVVSAMRRNVLSTLYPHPVESTAPGFEVVRPPRAPST